jgi:hypothetical protein
MISVLPLQIRSRRIQFLSLLPPFGSGAVLFWVFSRSHTGLRRLWLSSSGAGLGAAAQFSPDPLPLGFGPRRLLPRSSLGLRSLLLIFVALRSAKAVPFCCFGLLLELVCGFHGDCFGSTPKVLIKDV